MLGNAVMLRRGAFPVLGAVREPPQPQKGTSRLSCFVLPCVPYVPYIERTPHNNKPGNVSPLPLELFPLPPRLFPLPLELFPLPPRLFPLPLGEG